MYIEKEIMSKNVHNEMFTQSTNYNYQWNIILSKIFRIIQ